MTFSRKLSASLSPRVDTAACAVIVLGVAAFTCHRVWSLHATATSYSLFSFDFTGTCLVAAALCAFLPWAKNTAASTLKAGGIGGGLGLIFYILVLGFALVDPGWVPELPRAGTGQAEGFGYLGLGVFFLCMVAFPLIPWARTNGLFPPLKPLLVVVASLILLAFSVRITLGSHEILRVVSKHFGLLESFRSSGRFIWPSVYLFTTLAIAVVAKRNQPLAVAALVVACVLQFAEITPLHIYRMQLRLQHENNASLLHDMYWTDAVRGRSHITYVLPPACGPEAAPWLPFSLLAADNGMTINTGYVARFDEPRTFAYCETLKQQLAKGERSVDTLYIVHPDQLEQFRAESAVNMQCTTADGFIGCVVVPAS